MLQSAFWYFGAALVPLAFLLGLLLMSDTHTRRVADHRAAWTQVLAIAALACACALLWRA